MVENNVLSEKTLAFAIRVVNCYKYLVDNKKEFVMSKQILRCGTSIGANSNEAIYAQSKADFVSKLSIALKEASETEYWLELLHESDYISEEQFQSIIADNIEIIKILTSIVKNSDNNI